MSHALADHTLVAHSDTVDNDSCCALLTADAGSARVAGTENGKKEGGGANGGSVTNNKKFLGFLLFRFLLTVKHLNHFFF